MMENKSGKKSTKMEAVNGPNLAIQIIQNSIQVKDKWSKNEEIRSWLEPRRNDNNFYWSKSLFYINEDKAGKAAGRVWLEFLEFYGKFI